ncbi:MAG: response regulator transcription factor [Erythrobacter sp.]|nr:MAG: response regulator transcription factor [Erythrobacter sp.]
MEAEAIEAPLRGRTEERQVYVIDDDRDVRKSLHFLLGSMSITAWPFAGAKDFMEQLPELAPAPILIDIRMPDIDGIQLLEMLSERENSWPVIIMTAHGDVSIAVRAMKLGAIEFLEKPFGPEELQAALKDAYGVLRKTEAMLRVREDARSLFNKLTNREYEVIGHLMRGDSNKDVAHRLGLSVRTVELHRGSALAKLHVKKMAEVMTLAKVAELPEGKPEDIR